MIILNTSLQSNTASTASFHIQLRTPVHKRLYDPLRDKRFRRDRCVRIQTIFVRYKTYIIYSLFLIHTVV